MALKLRTKWYGSFLGSVGLTAVAAGTGWYHLGQLSRYYQTLTNDNMTAAVEIVPAIQKTSDLVQEITAASTEQASGATQITAAMSQLSQTTQHNASASEQLAATAEELSAQAQQLQELITVFQLASPEPPSGAMAEAMPPAQSRRSASPSRANQARTGKPRRSRTDSHRLAAVAAAEEGPQDEGSVRF